MRMSIPTINKGGVCAITLHFQPLQTSISAINAIFDNRYNTLAQQIIPYVVVKTATGHKGEQRHYHDSSIIAPFKLVNQYALR